MPDDSETTTPYIRAVGFLLKQSEECPLETWECLGARAFLHDQETVVGKSRL